MEWYQGSCACCGGTWGEVSVYAGHGGRHGLVRCQFEVPLDVHLHEVRSLQWKPLSLTCDVVRSQVGLLVMLRFVRLIGRHCVSPSPLLVATNIHYRMFNRAYARWDMS